MVLAAILRLYRADAQSLWYDEGTSVALAGRSLLQIARDAGHDVHPPLYYQLLAVWVRAFGNGVRALRGLSALIGVVGVAGVALLGRRLGGRGVALTAGLAAATSPYLVYYSQEVRSYILAAALVPPLVGLGLASAGRERGRAWWTAAGAATLAALYTHYFCGAVAVVAANIAFGVGLVRARCLTGARGWMVSQGLAGALFLPWLAYAWPTLRHWPAQGPPMAAAAVARAAAGILATGAGPPDPLLTRVVVAWAGVGVVALATAGRGRWAGALAVAAAAAAAPGGLAALSAFKPAWDPKFLASSAPAFEVLVAAGLVLPAAVAHRRLAARGRPRAGAALAAVVLAAAVATLVPGRARSLRAMYFDPAYQRDDYRGIAAAVATEAGPRDAVILDAPTQVEVFGYYHRGVPTYPVPESRPPDAAATVARLTGLGSQHRDFFAVLWATGEADPDGIVEGWLRDNRHKVYDRWYGNVRLARWAAPRQPAVRTTVDLLFGPALRLASLVVGPLTLDPGQVLTLRAEWDVLAPPERDWVVFTQLIDAGGRWAAGRDMRPGGGSEATSTWGVGSRHSDRIGLLVPAEAAPGRYDLVMGLYDPATGERLAVVGDDPASMAAGDHLRVGTVVIRGP